MDPIKGAGVNNYAMMAMPEQNTQVVEQYPATEQNYADYSSMPMVYDPTVAEKKTSAKSGAGLKALAALTIAGLALWGGHKWGAKSAKDAVAAVDGYKAAAEAAEAAKKALENENKALKDASAEALKIAENEKSGFFGTPIGNVKKVCAKITEALKKGTTEVAEKISDDVKKVVDDMQKVVKDKDFADKFNKAVDDLAKEGDDKAKLKKTILEEMKKGTEDKDAISAIDKMLEEVAK